MPSDVHELLALPYVRTGRFAREWQIRSRTFDRFRTVVLRPYARAVSGRPVRLVDLGAGNGWLCHRVRSEGCDPVALDIRDDRLDGLRAGEPFRSSLSQMFQRVVASFEQLPFAADTFDIAVFNASLHYALNLRAALAEAARVVVHGGRIAVLDSPFYSCAEAGEAMVAEKLRNAERHFGDRAPVLTSLPFIEYLTPERLATASARLGLSWRRHRVRYPLWYECRPFVARLSGRRPPSRFDLWETVVPSPATDRGVPSSTVP